MTPPLVRARAVEGVLPVSVRDPEVIQAYLEDASAYPGGAAAGLLRPERWEDAATFLRESAGRGVPVLPQAARSSLTGGAVPRGEVVLSVERWGAIESIDAASRRVVAQAGVRLRDLQAVLSERGLYFPPVPTYQEAMIGGVVSTNAGGAATFKYGVTRDWVRGLRVILANGDLLEIERGEVLARRGERFRVEASDGTVWEVPTPAYRLPAIKKLSVGYHAADPLDLVDLFVGSEGTLGIVAAATLDLLPLPPAVVTGVAFLRGTDAMRALTEELRTAAAAARDAHDRRGPDVRAIEWIDGRSLALLRSHGDVRRLRVEVPAEAGAAVLFEMELPEAASDDRAQELLAAYLDAPGGAPDAPLVRLFRILDRHGAIEGLELAWPGDPSRRAALHEFREAVPKRVNEILAERRRHDPSVRKMGGDVIVPAGRIGALIAAIEDGFARRGLEFAIWGHVSDGNLHPNALARTAAEIERAAEAMLEFADAAIALGGAPLSEHGVGRSPLKQEMARRFLGDAAIDSMRAIKRALDPEGRLAPGVLWPAS